MMTKSQPLTTCLFLFIWPMTSQAWFEKEDYAIYIEKSFLSSQSTPSLSIEKKTSKIKWFDDHPSQKTSGRTELGLINKTNGWNYSWRSQTISGVHMGAASKLACLGFFCSWIDSSVITGLSTSDRIAYNLTMNQLVAGKNIVDSQFATLALKAGIHVLSARLTIAGLEQTHSENGSVPLPVIGAKATIKMTDNLRLELDNQYTNFQKNGSSISIIDKNIDLSYDLNQFIKIAYGYGKLDFTTTYEKSETSVKLYIPQKSSHLKLAFIY